MSVNSQATTQGPSLVSSGRSTGLLPGLLISYVLVDKLYEMRGICRAMQDFSEGLTEDEGLAAMDAPGPRLLDGYDTDPGGADTERRARRRALLRRNIGRRGSALLFPLACLPYVPVGMEIP